jgi:hypothetical protein
MFLGPSQFHSELLVDILPPWLTVFLTLRMQEYDLFSFSQEQVLESARRHIGRNQDRQDNPPFDQAVLDWLQDVDWLAPSPVRLPHGWVGMESILLPLIEGNSFEIRCMGCQRNYRPPSLVCVPETHKFGSFHHILDCPEGHRLIAIETAHTV